MKLDIQIFQSNCIFYLLFENIFYNLVFFSVSFDFVDLAYRLGGICSMFVVLDKKCFPLLIINMFLGSTMTLRCQLLFGNFYFIIPAFIN